MDLEPDRYFFHYTTRDSFGGILSGRKLRLSPYEKMRDPLENQPWNFTFFSGSGPTDDAALIAKVKTQDRFKEAASKRIKKGCHLLSLTIDAKPSPGSEHELFSRGWARARLWEQYAEKHQGVCLVFDRDRLVQHAGGAAFIRDRSADLYAGPVSYDDRGLRKPIFDQHAVESEPDYLDEYIATHHEALFFRKTLDWETEHEYRFVAVSKLEPGSCDAPSLSMDYGDALTHVIAGEHLPGWQRVAVETACREIGAEALLIKWKNYRVGLDTLS
jgi:Protein of unknown function (DUF2971)